METAMEPFSPSLALFGIILVAVWIFNSIHVLREYERGVIFRLGASFATGERSRADLCRMADRQDRKGAAANCHTGCASPGHHHQGQCFGKGQAVVYFRVMNAIKAVVDVENYLYATSQLAQTTLRSILGEVSLDDLLSKRETLNVKLQSILDQHTDAWGIKVALVEVKQVDLPQEMQRAMAKQAEAEREKRAKIIHADGEFQAAEKLAQAAAVIAREPVAIQLRYLQTLTEIGVEKNTTVIFPIPVDFLQAFLKK